jgi:hypothetical protein
VDLTASTSDSNPDIMRFGISVLPPHECPSTSELSDCPPVGPLEVSYSARDNRVRLSSTCALPGLAYRCEALPSRGYRAPNPVWRSLGMPVVALTLPSPPRQTSRAVHNRFTPSKSCPHVFRVPPSTTFTACSHRATELLQPVAFSYQH